MYMFHFIIDDDIEYVCMCIFTYLDEVELDKLCKDNGAGVCVLNNQVRDLKQASIISIIQMQDTADASQIRAA